MIKKMIALIAVLAACGAPDAFEAPAEETRVEARARLYEAWQRGEDGAAEELDRAVNGEVKLAEPEEVGLGTARQAMGAKETADYQFGVGSGSTRLQCSVSNTFQTCSVPNTRTATFFIDPAGFGPPGTSYNDEMFKYVDQLRAQLTPEWTITEVFVDSPEPTWHFKNAACSGSFTSNSIAAFSCLSLDDSGTSVTEGTGVAGQYRVHTDCDAFIDMDDINARGLTGLEELRLLRHATGHVSLGCLGLGGRQDTGANAFASRMLVDVNFSPAVISTGERCRARSFVSSTNSVFNLITPACSGAN